MTTSNVRDLRQRAIRIMVGGLLSSDLSDAELQQLSTSLRDSEIMAVADALARHFAKDPAEPATRASGDEEITAQFEGSNDPHPLLSTIYERVRGKKIGTVRLLGYMKDVNPEFVATLPRGNISVLQLLDHFLRYSSHSEAQKLFDRIVGPSQQDPYLTGITRKG